MILDYIWKSLFLGSVSATVYLAVMILAAMVLKRASAAQMKWYFNSQILILAIILLGGFFVAAVDTQLLAGCFDAFVKQSSSFTITRWIAAAWIFGFGAYLAGDLYRAAMILRKTRSLEKVSDPVRVGLFQALKVKLGVRSNVDLYLIDESLSPFALGILQHKVVVPDLPLSESVLTSALAHELIHVRDRDSLWLTLELFCRRVLFWHPLAHMFSRIYLLTLEKAADEAAVNRAALNKQDFLSALLELAALSTRGPSTPLRLNASRGYRECKARIESLLTRSPETSIWNIPAIVIALLTPIAMSVAQANTVRRAAPLDPRMCIQVDHEKVIESWLRIESPPKLKCDK